MPFEPREFGFINDNICPVEVRGLRLNSGHVYLIRPVNPPKGWFNGVGECPIKIGVSKDSNGVAGRLKALSSGNWMQLCVEKISPVILEPFNIEWLLHEEYRSKKIKGEWYNLTIDEVRIIKKQLTEEPYLQFADAMWSDKPSGEYYHFLRIIPDMKMSLISKAWDAADEHPYRKDTTWARHYMWQDYARDVAKKQRYQK